MYINRIILVLSTILLASCNSKQKTEQKQSNVTCIGAMKDVMWKGKLKGSVLLDTLSKKEGLYALGPAEYLRGELLVIDGKSYKSTVVTDSTMHVAESFNVKAPFLVYGNVTEWNNELLPKDVKTIADLERYMKTKINDETSPFVFVLKGSVNNASIHIQNLPEGSKVSSPKEAHIGQTNYDLNGESVDIVGFYSTNHKGVFTHHDTNMHMHLITSDRKKMGHLDAVVFNEGIQLYLPK